MTKGLEQGGYKARTQPQRLVASRVAALPPGTYTDPGQTGLQLRVREKRGGASRTWLLRFKFRGEETRILLGHFPQTSLDAARGEARRLRELADQGIDPRRARARRRERPAPLPGSSATAKPGDRYTVEFLASEFLERYVKPHRRRPEYADWLLKRDALKEWRGRDARTITPTDVVELLDGIVDRGAPVLANRTAALLSQLFRFGIQRRIVESTPVQLLMRPGGREKPRERVLTEEELKAFLADPEGATRYPKLAHAMTALLLTGQRRGELARAKWADIDFEAKTWTIPDENSKTGRGHVVPLSNWAVEEFQALKRLANRSRWVLPTDDGKSAADPQLLTRGLARCLARFKQRKVAAFNLHDLRRTCRTGLSRLKVEPHIAERVLNHVQPGVAGVYDRFAYLEEKRAALEKWASHLHTTCMQNPKA
ncbi:MAG TPA: tyrosine-type recombinase/integrase [Steroidobacteraceae bacterium]|jgi:integrase